MKMLKGGAVEQHINYVTMNNTSQHACVNVNLESSNIR